MSKFVCALMMFVLVSVPQVSRAAASDHWVGTWAASPMGASNDKALMGSADMTLRQVVRVSIGGSMVRVVLTNEFGTDSLTVGAAQVAPRVKGDEIQTAAAIALTFHGQSSVVIPAGAMVLSDPVALKVPALSDLTISMLIPKQTVTQMTQHGSALATSYAADGNQVAAKTLTSATEFYSWRFIKGVEVMAPAASGAIVALGDSITDGAQSTRNANARWPDVLAARLQGDKKTAGIAVLNQGIGGNRLVHDITGPSALARFDRDVLGQSGVKYLIVLEGINDIGKTVVPQKPDDPIQTEQLLLALQQIIDRAHAHGIKVYGATLTPYRSAKYASAAGETMREAENAFIRSGKFDGVIDFDMTTLDPSNPLEFLPAYDSGDHLHPKDAGYKAMGESIDLKLFEK